MDKKSTQNPQKFKPHRNYQPHDIQIKIEAGLGQSTYPGQMGHFLQVIWFTGSNERKPTVDLDHLVASDYHSIEHNSVLLVLETFLKE